MSIFYDEDTGEELEVTEVDDSGRILPVAPFGSLKPIADRRTAAARPVNAPVAPVLPVAALAPIAPVAPVSKPLPDTSSRVANADLPTEMELWWMPLPVAIRSRTEVMELEAHQRGWYIWLRLAAWTKGGYLPRDERILCKLAGADPTVFHAERETVLRLFEIFDDQQYFDPAVRKEYAEKQLLAQANARKSAHANEMKKKHAAERKKTKI